MKRIIRLTESDLARIVRRVINEEMEGGTHSPMYHLAQALTPFGFEKLNNYSSVLGPDGVFNGLSKGDDSNGVYIYYSSSSKNIELIVSVNGKTIINKTYPLSPPDYLVDHNKILKDLGAYKTYKFKKTVNKG
jgi:hypothetical protein